MSFAGSQYDFSDKLRAYGELAPVACNDSLEARQLNRRVEVWVKD